MSNLNIIVQRTGLALSCCLTLLLLLGGTDLVHSQQLQQAAHVTTTTTTTTGAGVKTQAAAQSGSVSEDQRKFDAWKSHPLFVAPFDPKILALPDVQLAFVRNMTAKDLEMFREISEEAIRIRNKWTPSVKLMFKYTGRLLGTFIRNRREESRIPLRVEPSPEFFNMLADLVQSVLDRSATIKREKGYSKSTLDVDTFKARVFATFDYIKRIINASPLGGYLKWNELKMFMDEPKNPLHKGDLVESVSDMVAQYRAMGYESTIFVGRRIVNMLRLFGRGVIPSDDKEV